MTLICDVCSTPYTTHGNREGEYVTTLPDQLTTAVTRGKEYTRRKRTSYARYLWMKETGPIPDGLIVYNNNFPEVPLREDLELITRAELVKRNKT